MSLAAEAFCENVERFCDWAESTSHSILEARQLLLSLMQSIPHLESFRGLCETDLEFDRRGHEGWVKDFARLSDLPFQFYRIVSDPQDLENDEPVIGDLCDDLADIYGDLFEGREAYRAGFPRQAIGMWVDSYFYHWGEHAASAIWAIDDYYRKNQGSEKTTGASE